MSFALYLGGFVLLIIGLAVGASLLHVATHWIVVGVIVMIGLAILKGATKTRQRDPS